MPRPPRFLKPRSLPGDRPENPTALLVESEDPLRALFRRILELAGYRVLEARDTGDAISMLSRSPGSVELVFAELTGPGVLGRGGLRERIPRGVKLLLTVRGESDDPARVLEDGTTFVVTNPLRGDALGSKLRELRSK